MTYFKKFCDLIGGIGAFFATVFVLGRYMEYNPSDTENKLKIFFSSENAKEYRQYLVFIVLLFGAVLLGRVFKKIPEATLFLSVLPLIQILGMLWHKRLYDDAEFYIIVCITVVAGNVYEAFTHDKNGGRKTLALSVVTVGAFGVLTSFLSVKFSSMAKEYSEIFLEDGLSEAEELLSDRLSFFGIDLISNVPEKEEKTLLFIAILLSVCVLISLAAIWLKGLRFLCPVFSALPFFYAMSALHTENYATSPMLVLVPVAVFFICNCALAVKSSQ